tara:strand:- start:74 stop:319 length:246 start_codon:yes stop_codon:yes gene_type:complete
MDSKKFVETLKQCVDEYKKQDRETDDVAHFYDERLKKFLIANKALIDVLFTMSFEQHFKKFVVMYIWKDGSTPTQRNYSYK